MTRLSYPAALDRALGPLGFERQDKDWLRRQGDFLEVVNLQHNPYAGTTANLFFKDLASESILREATGALNREDFYIPSTGGSAN